VLPASYQFPAAVIITVGGLLACFVGYRLFRLILGLYGAVLGAALTAAAVGTSHPWTLVLAIAVGALVGAVLMIAAYYVGVGLIGAGIAALALRAGWSLLLHGPPPTVVLVIVSVLGALGALSIVRYVVIFGTALAGAWTLVIGGLALLGDAAATQAVSTGDVWMLNPLDPVRGRLWISGLWFVVTLLGVVVQLTTTRGKLVRSAKQPRSQK
jgi:hypothetical protein